MKRDRVDHSNFRLLSTKAFQNPNPPSPKAQVPMTNGREILSRDLYEFINGRRLLSGGQVDKKQLTTRSVSTTKLPATWNLQSFWLPTSNFRLLSTKAFRNPNPPSPKSHWPMTNGREILSRDWCEFINGRKLLSGVQVDKKQLTIDNHTMFRDDLLYAISIARLKWNAIV
jgi:hypothetical protein